MTVPTERKDWALSEKEKQTLRLMVRGHDAKSIARELGLSVHTINERLRDARRKMAVSSSREAARLLFERESVLRDAGGDESFGNTAFGDDMAGGAGDRAAMRSSIGRRPLVVGASLMTLVLALLALVPTVQETPAPSAVTSAANPAVVDAARRWLALVDGSRWEDSYRETGKAFRALNTVTAWTTASTKVRETVGTASGRTFVGQENLPAPPSGYEVVKFRTRYSKAGETIETVTLDREDGVWRVVGVTVG